MSNPLWWQLREPSWAILFSIPLLVNWYGIHPQSSAEVCGVTVVALGTMASTGTSCPSNRCINSISRTIQCTFAFFIVYLRCFEHDSHLTKALACMRERALTICVYACVLNLLHASVLISKRGTYPDDIPWVFSRGSISIVCVWSWMGSGCPQPVATPSSVKKLPWPHGTTGWRPPR